MQDRGLRGNRRLGCSGRLRYATGMVTMRRAVNGQVLMILLIAVLIVVHLLAVHGHEDVTILEACLVLLVPLVVALMASRISATPTAIRSVSIVATRLPPDQEARRLLPVDTGTVMRH